MSNEHDTNLTADAGDRRLDEVLEGIRAESPDAGPACARVRERLRKEAGWSAPSTDAAVIAMGAETELRDCSDYQELIPAWIAGELGEGRALLVSDHVRHCVSCRRAVNEARSGATSRTTAAGEGSGNWRRFAIAASFLAAIFASWFAWRHLLPAPQDDLLEVKSMEGQLFALEGDRLQPLFPGDVVDGRQEIRTAKDSGAVLELADGSRVEVNERSALEVVAKRDGLRVRVDHGDVIVEAARQRNGTLDVTTDEMLVAVKGTIFAVSHGTKGSRVSVIEGEVQVEQARRRTALYPGDQLGSRATLASYPLAQEIGWSGDVDRYLAMLEEFGRLRSDLNQVLASAEPRYSSTLLEHVPSNTAVYVALPNPTATLAEVYGLIRQRLLANPLLADEWGRFGDDADLARLDSFVDSVQELSGFLGEETVVALGFDELQGGEPTPMVLSEVENAAGLRDALQAKIDEISAQTDGLSVILLDPSATTVPSGEHLFVWIGNGLLVATTEIAEINRVASGTTSGFVGTDFHGTVAQTYDRGAEYLGAVDLGALIGSHLSDADHEALHFTGLGDVEYLVVERHQDEGERVHTAADLTFAGERQGMAAWLAAPAALESLEFVSANATFASGAVHKDPAMIFDEIFGLASTQDEDAAAELGRVESEIGFRFRDDLAAALGGEVTVALDGPMLPTPAWKLIVEVYDERRLQATLETLVQRMRDEGADIEIRPVEGADGRLFYEVVGRPEAEQQFFDSELTVAYTYVDGFMVAGPSRALVEQSILYRESGASLVTSEVFQELLPTDGYVDFSAVVFNRIGETVADLAAKLPTPEGFTEEQRAQVDALLEDIAAEGPSIYCLYGENDRIRLVSNSPSFLPFSGLGSLIGLGGLPGVLSGTTASSLGSVNTTI